MPVELDSHESDTTPVASALFTVGDDAGSHPGHAREASAGAGPGHLFSYRVFKRAFDLFLVIVLSPILLPIIGGIAAAVRLSSPGPVFFSHRRIRGHGRFFSMWKFRTMCVNSQEVLDRYLTAHPEARAEWIKSHKLKDDPRVTTVGKFLRRSSLDELPQIWNVLTGSMSLVGPRPIVAAEVEKYGEFFADYCLVKPGVTGLWQVSGRSKISYPQRVQFDRTYAQTWTFAGDLKILVRTLFSVANRDGAY